MSAGSTNSRRLIRQTLTIARRDFVATVFAPMFLVFLLSPLIMIGFGAGGGMAAQSMASGSADKSRLLVLAPTSEAPVLSKVESEADLRALADLDFPFGQGHLFGVPKLAKAA